MGIQVTYKALLFFCTLTAGVTGLITFVLSNVYLAYKMEKKYALLPANGNGFRLKSEAFACMDERKMAEQNIIKVLRRMEKRMILGNLVMRRLIETSEHVKDDEICKFEKDLGLDLNDRDLGIPD